MAYPTKLQRVVPAPRRSPAVVHRPLAINGRFLAQPLTGVQRYAREIVGAMDRLIAEGRPWGPVTLLLPPDATPLPGLTAIAQRTVGRHRGHRWEQADLARAAQGQRLLSLGNAGPLLHPRQVVTLHDAGIYAVPGSYSRAYRLWYRFQFRWFARRAEQVVTVSAFSAGELARLARVPRDRLSVVPNAAEHLDHIAADPSILAGLEPGSYVLAIGSPKPHKNLAAVGAALALMAEPRPRLVVAGHANPRGLAGGALPDGTVALGAVTEGQLKALYENALCLAFPSTYEGFGIPPLEAMACGCPAVVARTSSLPEVCGGAALYCDPHDPATLAAAIGRLVAEPGLRTRMIARGRARAGEFGWTAGAARLMDVIEALDR